MIKVVRIEQADDGRRWLRYLDGECFPDDKPLRLVDAYEWYLVSSGKSSALDAFCGWRPINDMQAHGFLSRAGVLPTARGQGLHKFMIDLREDAMRKAGQAVSITYTEACSVASMRSLVACGYKPFEPTGAIVHKIVVSKDRWRQMVYWKKML